MGQYYIPVSINKEEGLNPHDFLNGAKLMEHSYINNDLVKNVEFFLSPLGPWHETKFVWAGDYADEEVKRLGKGDTLYSFISEHRTIISPYKVNSLKDKAIALSDEEDFEGFKSEDYPFIVNHSKRQFVDKRKALDNDGWKIHPLPLLTADGNGRGGGDYYESSPDFDKVGMWKKDIISVEKDMGEYADYEEVIVNFKER